MPRRFLALFALPFVLAAVPARAAPCPPRTLWPTDGWMLRTMETAAARAAEIRALEDFAFTLTGADEERLGVRTDAVVIVREGAVVYERYARGYSADARHYTWSVSKSVTNALVGLAVAQGAVKLDDGVCRHAALPKLDNGKDHCDITIQNLLEFSSGLDWTETYEGQSNQVSSVLAMLYGEGAADTLAFIASHPSRDPPGATYMYSSGDTTLLAGVVDRAMRPRLGEDWMWKLLFDPLGVASAVFERDAAGSPIGSSWFYATPRDMAKLGYFFLSDGCWENQRLLPEDWMRDSTSVSTPFKLRPLGTDPDDVQGRQFWLNRPVPEQNVKTPWPDVPEDAFAARGHWGQSITVVPSLDLVIVRVADDRESRIFDFNRFLKLAIAVGRP